MSITPEATTAPPLEATAGRKVTIHDHVGTEKEDERKHHLGTVAHQFARALPFAAHCGQQERLVARFACQNDADARRHHEKHRDLAQRIEAPKRDQNAGYDIGGTEICRNLGQVKRRQSRQCLALAITGNQPGKDDAKTRDNEQDEHASHEEPFAAEASFSSRRASTTVVRAIGVRIEWAARDSACDDNGLVIKTK